MLSRGRELAIVFSPILDPTSLRPKVSHELRLRAKKKRGRRKREGVSQSHYLTVAVQPGAFLTGQGRERK